MTRQESFKNRVRARMAKTGEQYTAARRVLLQQATARRTGRVRIAEPELGDDAVRNATGRDWDQWCDLIDEHPGRTAGHSQIAAHLSGDLGVDPWWAQTVTVGYERISGLRLPYQQPDGTFTASKSRTVALDAANLRQLLLDDGQRAELFPGLVTTLRSRPTSKALRIRIGPGIALFSLDAAPGGRTKVSIAHAGLAGIDQVQEWKFYWSEWLDAAAGEPPAGPSIGADGESEMGGQRGRQVE